MSRAEQVPSEELIRRVRAEIGPRVVLSFSRGKDSIASYIALRPHFDEVIPYHLYRVPGMSFVEESLAYYERVIGRHIINLPHPALYRMLNNYVYQPLDRVPLIAAMQLPTFDFEDIVNLVLQQEDLPDTMLVASGVRAADNPVRMLNFRTHGALNRKKRQFYPVWDWKKARLIAEIQASGIKLPRDYDLFGRSFDGIDLRYLAPLKRHSPDDYRRLLEWFPLADITLWNLEKEGRA